MALTQDIIPEMAKSFRELADLIESLGPLLRGVGVNIGGGLGAINDLIDINRQSKTGAARLSAILGRGRIAPGERGFALNCLLRLEVKNLFQGYELRQQTPPR